MASQSLILEFRSAYEMGKNPEFKSLMSDNQAADVIRSFANDKRFKHFLEDVPAVVREDINNTLADVDKLREAASELDILIKQLETLKTDLITQGEQIIENHVQAGKLQDEFYEIIPLVKMSRRSPDMAKIQRHEKEWNELLSLKLEKIKTEYKPTQAELKTVFGKQFEAFLSPGEEEITGYDIRLLMSVKAGTVEP